MAPTPGQHDIKTKGLKEWQKAEIVLDNAFFTGRQNSQADFRIVAKTTGEKQFYVRSVTLSEN